MCHRTQRFQHINHFPWAIPPSSSKLRSSHLGPASKTDLTKPTLTRSTSELLPCAISPLSNSSTLSAIEIWLENVNGSKLTITEPPPDSDCLYWPRASKRKRSLPLDVNVVKVFGPGLPLNGTSLRKHTAMTDGNENPQTPQKQSDTTTLIDIDTPTTKTSPDALTVARRLDERMIYQDKPVYSDFPQFKELAESVKTLSRLSGVKPESKKRYHEHLNEYQYDNEDTFLNEILSLIIKREHGVDTKSHSEWWSEGLKVNTNREFKRGSLPNCYGNQEYGAEIAKLLRKVDGMTNPKSDRTYGVRPSFLFPPENVTLSMETDELMSISPGLIAAFLFLEGKSYAGNMFEAENQARRGGATLLHAGHKLFKLSGREDAQGPDMKTYVYSVTLDPQAIKVWVHWAEVQSDGKVPFHMNRIFGCLLDDDDAEEKIRNILHNIIEWGLNERFDLLKQVYAKVWASEPRRLKVMAGQIQAKKDVGRQAKRQKRNSAKDIDSLRSQCKD